MTVSVTKVITNGPVNKRKSVNRATDAIFTFGHKNSLNKQRSSKASSKNSEQNRKMRLTFDI